MSGGDAVCIHTSIRQDAPPNNKYIAETALNIRVRSPVRSGCAFADTDNQARASTTNGTGDGQTGMHGSEHD